MRWEVRGVMRGFRWDNEVSLESDSWREGGVSWRLKLDKPADAIQVKLTLRLVDSHGRSGAKGSQSILLQRVPTAVAEKTDNGFLSGKANSVPWVSFEGDNFAAGASLQTSVGITLSAIQLAGCYNAQRDSILIVVD